ncbi:hypothetical protein ILYODFUR_001999 [Ilyodon furcidens]|uniref:PH domain-containing protein n=1 Tax=Ilyodon furcidens TaxID=33524 RepID=A0ABV0SUQ6_9TELE
MISAATNQQETCFRLTSVSLIAGVYQQRTVLEAERLWQTGAAAMDEQSMSLNSSTQHCGGYPTTKGQRSNVIRCGWLRKQGGFVKTWHSRWFVLRGELLYYYKDEEETKPLVSLFVHSNICPQN